MDRSWIEVTGKLARYVVLRRSKEGRITRLNREGEERV
jgi:hypothetical protein